MKGWTKALLDLYRSLWDRFIQLLQRRPLISFVAIICLAIAISAFLLNEAEGTGLHSYWRSLVYMLSGIDVDPPDTFAGECIAALTLVFGVVLVSLFTGFVASEFSRLLETSFSIPRKRERQYFENHIILFGWGAKTKAVLRELNAHFRHLRFLTEDIVVVSDDEHLERGTEEIYKHVVHVRGSASDRDVLKRANLDSGKSHRGAHVAAIVSDARLKPVEADRQSLLTLLAVENMHPAVVSLVDVVDQRNAEHFINANADEVLVPGHYAALLLARAAEYPGVAAYIDELLALAEPQNGETEKQVGRDPISFYVKSAKEMGLTGLSLSDAVMKQFDTSDAILVGVLTETGVVLVPDSAAARYGSLSPENQLVFIATPSQL